MLFPDLRAACGRARDQAPGSAAPRVPRASWAVAVWLMVVHHSPAFAQYPPPHIADLNERSGLLMRFAGTREQLPPDPLRDNFYNTRFADRGLIKHPDGIKDQGL